jgi:hypothetical protein
MGKEARIGLLLGAAACLLAVMVDWVIEDLNREEEEEAERAMREGQTRMADGTTAPAPAYAGQSSGGEAGSGGA